MNWIKMKIYKILSNFTPLKNSIRTADEFSSKYPVQICMEHPYGVRIQIFTCINLQGCKWDAPPERYFQIVTEIFMFGVVYDDDFLRHYLHHQ